MQWEKQPHGRQIYRSQSDLHSQQQASLHLFCLFCFGFFLSSLSFFVVDPLRIFPDTKRTEASSFSRSQLTAMLIICAVVLLDDSAVLFIWIFIPIFLLSGWLGANSIHQYISPNSISTVYITPLIVLINSVGRDLPLEIKPLCTSSLPIGVFLADHSCPLIYCPLSINIQKCISIKTAITCKCQGE